MEQQRRETFFKEYLSQKEKLPLKVRSFINKRFKDSKIVLYGLIDLSEDYCFCERWVLILASSESYMFAIAELNKGEATLLTSFSLDKVTKIIETNSLSSVTLSFLTSIDSGPLAVLRYTFRQKIMMGHVKYLVEQCVAKNLKEDYRDLDADHLYVESSLKPILEAQNSVSSEHSQTLWRLLSYLLPYKKDLMVGAIGAFLMTVISLVPAYLSGRLIDQVIQPFQNGSLSLDEAAKMAWLLVGTLVTTYVLKEVFVWLRLKKMSILGEKVARDLRTKLFNHLQTLSMDFYSKKQTGSIISRVSSDTDRIWDFIAFGVVELSIALISLMSLSSVLIYLDWRLGLVMSLPVPLLLFSIYRHGELMKGMFLKAWRKWSDVTAILSDTIPGMQVVKAFHQENKEMKRFDDKNTCVTDEFNEIHVAWTRFWPMLMLGIHTIMMTVWILAIPRLITPEIDHSHLSAGTFISFLLYMTMFSQPIEIIGQVARMLNRALSSAYRIFEILDTKPTIKVADESIKIEKVKGKVEFKNVFFSYDGVRFILKGLNLKIEPGEMIGLVGSSGGGKSTITKLLTRFYDINSGSILIDGVDLKKIDLGHYRRQVGMVLQEPYLFHGSIRDNISYGVPEATNKEIVEAAKVANAHDFINGLPHGYDTVIGERGHTLSGGERQRVSIARAVLANPRILILDEATSAVDTETERNIQDALDRLVVGRTVIAIAHRLSTLRKADRILVVGKGEIVEEGTHRDLLTIKDGEYSKLHQMQKEMSESFAL